MIYYLVVKLFEYCFSIYLYIYQTEHVDSFFFIGEKAEVGPVYEKSKNYVAQQHTNAIVPNI